MLNAASKSGGNAIGSRIGGGFEHTLRVRNNQPGVTDPLIEVTQQLELMAACPQLAHDCVIESILQLERV